MPKRRHVDIRPTGTFARTPPGTYVDPACPECGKLWEIDGHKRTCSRYDAPDGIYCCSGEPEE